MLKKFQLTLAVLSSLAIIGCKPADTAKEKSVMVGLPSQDSSSALQDANAFAAEAFLAKNKLVPGVITTASGLQYAVIASGPATGLKPTADSIVQVNYEGTLLNGEVFDSSFKRGEAAEFPVGQLIPAWVEALQMMRPGDEWTIWVPPAIGYGAQGGGPIPPNSLLIFRMRLEKIVSGPGAK
ncbi:FKBP-type peptidyl-prolyl cis-trans isomerase [Candidatus Phycosocius spiralis]|uniref:Peptidyl-prolyl cis-trans isomerase n=1 Tax=Candidatus Phycosocius spiralis TaxID=2815099 RepID=A0ABQ4PWI4_9PROT|nr:FKBP-type peptidyl-prolyl cis-trans isomerase [Candidatus Phycosocius spiralis]GIU67014.1 peptidyl-prolyl cis-trans isomerase [Candidatus Phycosocius spiralis]